MSTRDLRYPIGQFDPPPTISADQVAWWIDEIEHLPAVLRSTVEPLTQAQLSTPYRPDGWQVRQVVHHVADSHINSYVRFKWALTEERPTIKAYFEDRWAELSDYSTVPVEVSLALLDSLHARWVALLRSLDENDLRREFVHPEWGPVSLATTVGIYAWHGRHHVAHITRLADREGWSE